MRTLIPLAMFLLVYEAVEAKPTSVTEFNGDRYAAVQVVEAKQRKKHKVPVPKPRPGYVAPISTFIAHRPAGCPARRWCGCWLAKHLGMNRRDLWLARNWARVGRPTSPQPGAIVVWHRHVGKVTAVEAGRIKVLSGNDGRMVRERWRSARGVIAYRML